MSTSFPNSLDSFVNPSTSSNLSDPAVLHSTQHDNINDAMTAVQTKLGANGSLVVSTIDYLLKSPSSIDPGHVHTAGSLTAPGTNGQLIYNSANAFEASASLVWDNTNTCFNVGTAVSVNSAIVQMASTSQGFLKPKMTQTQRLAIASPVEGLEVYDLTNHGSYYYTGTAWAEVTPVDNSPSTLSADAATTGALAGSPVYNNGSSGVGATLTGTGALPNQDGVALVNGQVLLVKNQASTLQNGLYTITQHTANYIITRSTNCDTTAELDPLVVQVVGGSTQAGSYWDQTTPTPTIGVNPITFAQGIASNVVIQQTSGTQAVNQIPFYTATARQLTKGVPTLTFNSSTNTLATTNILATTAGIGASIGTVPTNGMYIQGNVTFNTVAAVDVVNGRFGVGTTTPSFAIDCVGGAINVSTAGQFTVGGKTLANGSSSVLTLGTSAWTNIQLQTSGALFTLPNADGSSGQFLQTDGSGVLTFASSTGLSTTLANGNLYQGNASNVATSVAIIQDTTAVNSIDPNGRQLVDGSGTLSIDWQNRQLKNTSGTAQVDYQNDQLLDGASVVSFDWQNRIARDGVNNTSVDYDQRFLTSNSGINVVQWNIQLLSDNSNNITVDWTNHFLQFSSVQVLHWDTGILLDSGGTQSFNWFNRQLYDTGSVIALDYSARTLQDSSGTVVANWGAAGGPFQFTEDVNITGNITASNLNSSTSFLPTVSTGTNVTSATPSNCQWSQVGNVVTVSGRVQAVTISSTTNSDFLMSVPVSTSFSGGASDAGGTAANTTTLADFPVGISANAPGFVQFTFSPLVAGSNLYTFSYVYQIN